MIIEGPNCLGIVNGEDGIPLTFVLTPPCTLNGQPGIALVAQSGAMAAVLGVNFRSHGLGISFSISTGNEAVTGVEDYVEYLIEDERTSVIAMIVELFRQPQRFLQLVRRAREQGKHIVLLHPGRSSAARASAATHTGAIVRDYDVMRTTLRHAGVLVVDSLEELVDVSQMLIRCPSLPSGGAAVFTESGAFKALALDFCESVRLPVPPPSSKTADALRRALPEFIPPTNPLDITAQALVDPDLYKRTLHVILNDENYGSVVLVIILTDENTIALKFPPILDAIRSTRSRKPIIFAGLDEGAQIPSAYVHQLRELRVPFFPSPERALRALARVTEFAAMEMNRLLPETPVFPKLPLRAGAVPEYESKKILALAGIRTPTGTLAHTREEAQTIATQIGFPVVLKAQCSDLLHKSEKGGVALDLRDVQAIGEAWDRLYRNVTRTLPNVVLDGMLVEHMEKQGAELIVGARRDPDWGPVLLVGAGGVLAEALHDVRLLPSNLSIPAVVSELHQLKCGALLRGFRGSPPLDIHAVAEIVQRLGSLMLSEPNILEIEMNPIRVYPEGEGAVALDALIVTSFYPR